MNFLSLNKLMRGGFSVTFLAIALTACSSDDGSDIVTPSSKDGFTIDSVSVEPIVDYRLGAFAQFDRIPVSGLPEGQTVMVSVSEPFTYQIERNGQIVTERSNTIPNVTDVEAFYADGDFDRSTVYKTLIPEGFTSFSKQVRNGDIIVLGGVAAKEPQTSIRGSAKIGLTELSLLLTTGEADTTPNEITLEGAESAISAAPNEQLEVTFFVNGIDYSSSIEIVADGTPKNGDEDSDALGSALFSIGYSGIPGYEDRMLQSTTVSDESNYELIEESVEYLKAHFSQIAAEDEETAIRKEAQDNDYDSAWIDAQIEVRIPQAIEDAKQLVEEEVEASFGNYLKGIFIRVTATAPSEYDQETEVVLRVGTQEVVWPITTTTDIVPDPIEVAPPERPIGVGETYTTTFVVRGINALTEICISNGTFAINGIMAEGNCGFVSEGDEVTVYIEGSSEFSDTVEAVINIGGQETKIVVETEAPDTTPDPFEFESANASPDEYKTSEPQVLTGFNDSTEVFIAGGEYSISGGDFTDLPSTLTPGQSIAIRLQAAPTDGAESTATLTVGGVEGTFTVYATAELEGQTLFPPKHSFTESDRVQLRGQLTPAAGRSISTLTVAGQSVAVANDYSWTAEYSNLLDGENELFIDAVDSEGQIWTDRIIVVKGSVDDSFGSGELLTGIHDVSIDTLGQKYYVLSSDQKWKGENKIIEVDMATGNRRTFVDIASVNAALSGSGGAKTSGVQYIPSTQEIIIPNHVDDALYKVSTKGYASSRVSDSTVLSGYKNGMNVGNGDNTNDPMEMAVDFERNQIIIANVHNDADGIVAVDLETGNRTQIFSDTALSVAVDVDGVDGTSGDSYFYVKKKAKNVLKIELDKGNAQSVFASGFNEVVSLDTTNDSLIIGDHGAKVVYRLNLLDASQIKLSDSTIGENRFSGITAVATDESLGYIVLTDNVKGALLAIDLESGSRVFLSRN